MADMVEVIIQIPKDEYNCIRNGQKTFNTELYLLNAVNAGTVLPKGHGRLFDMDKLLKQVEFKGFIQQDNTHLVTMDRVKNVLNNAPTVIEADKEVENE